MLSFLTKFKHKIFFTNPALFFCTHTPPFFFFFPACRQTLAAYPSLAAALWQLYVSYMQLTIKVFKSSNLWKHRTFSAGCREEEEIKFPGIFYEFQFFIKKRQETVKVKYFVVAFVCFLLLFLNQVIINPTRVQNATKALLTATSSTSSQCVYPNGHRIGKCNAVVTEIF